MIEASQGRIMRPAKAAERLGISVTTLWRYARTIPDFPRPVKLSSRVTVFDEGQLAAWFNRRATESHPAA